MKKAKAAGSCPGALAAAAARANRTRRARLREPRCPNRHPKKGAP
jgi:hypothetical protein